MVNALEASFKFQGNWQIIEEKILMEIFKLIKKIKTLKAYLNKQGNLSSI